MWSQRDPSLRKSGAGNIFIKNLDPAIDNKALHDTFSAFGNILSCKVASKDGMSKCFGFVHYETKEAADAAIKSVDGMLLNNKPVHVCAFKHPKTREAALNAIRSQFTNLYVNNLPEEMTKEGLYELFAPYGTILSCVIQLDHNGHSRGFGFVNFEDHECAQAAIAALNGHKMGDKGLLVSRAQKKAEREEELRRRYEVLRQERVQKYSGNNIYVKNIDDEFTEETLKKEFSPFGTISSAKIMTDDRGISRGFGFVCFCSPDEATKAVTEMNGKIIGMKPLYVALAQRKEQRRAQLQAHYVSRQLQQPYPIGPVAPQLTGPPGGMYPAAPLYYAAPPPPPPPQRSTYYGANSMVRPPRWQNTAPLSYPMGAPTYAPQLQHSTRPPRVPRSHQQQQQQQQPGGGHLSQNNNGGGLSSHPSLNQHTNRSAASSSRPPRTYHQGFKYTVSARNTMMPNGPISGNGNHSMGGSNMHHGPPPPSSSQISSSPYDLPPTLTPAALASADPQSQKRLLGEALFPRIYTLEPELAPKITGMLLEMDNNQILHLLDSPDDLNARVVEAARMIRQHLEVAEVEL
ncbi:hypothetical protein HMI55_006521 [Coelomomyces lativittatus]|nr:hypothetical protein HMI55_006521 [Coelomomyces lativittatus]